MATTISSLKTSKRTLSGHTTLTTGYSATSDEAFAKLLLDLQMKEKHPVALHYLVSPFNNKLVPLQVTTELPRRMTSFFDASKTHLSIEEIEALSEDFIAKYSLDDAQRTVIEQLTKAQCESKVWNYMREGRITGSKCFQVVRSNLTNPSKSLLQQVVYPTKCGFKSASTEYVCVFQFF